MANFSPIALMVREEEEVVDGRTEGWTRDVTKILNSYQAKQGSDKPTN